MAGQTIVEFFPEHEGYKCGYCKSKDTNYSRGMWAHSMTVQDYQALIDRGWRRSGKYVYKPTLNKTCCPQYTIKCDSLKFKPNKSHKKVIKAVNKYLKDDIKRGTQTKSDNEMECSDGTKTKTSTETSGGRIENEGAASMTASAAGIKEKKSPKPGVGADPDKPLCKKAKQIRMERKMQKRREATGADNPDDDHSGKNVDGKTLDDILSQVFDNPAHRLELKLVRSSPRSQEFERSLQESYNVYKRYQITIHGDPPEKPSERQFCRFLVDSPLEIKLLRSAPQSEEFKKSLDESYLVYQKYQMWVHGDAPSDCDRNTFMDFLVVSPLKMYGIMTEELVIREIRIDEAAGRSDSDSRMTNFEPEQTSASEDEGFGSFHQQYILDGKIIAVGVIDILPNCVSSVYLYYDPDFNFLSLGTYSALREVSFTRQLHAVHPSIEFYYMGFYIFSCPKMKYKGQFHPSFLACPETYQWVPIERCIPKLEQARYARFSDEEARDDDGDIDLSSVLVLHRHQVMPYMIYQALTRSSSDEDVVTQYATLVGKTCAERMLLYRS